MSPEDDYDLRKFRRQMGPHGHWFMVAMILGCLLAIRFLAEQLK